MNGQPRQETACATACEAARPARRRVATRLWGGLLLLACLAVLGLAMYLKPDPRGLGTHGQLGTGQCGMLIMTGYPCPTCGMTTAFAHAVRGQWGHAFWAQPAGFVLALATMGLAAVSGWTVVSGRWPRIGVTLVSPYRLFVGLLLLLVGGWVFKIIVGLADGTLPMVSPISARG